MMVDRAYHALGAVACVALFVWAAAWFVQPSVEPNNPSASLFEVRDADKDAVFTEQSDFVLRPLFIRGRRAPDELVLDDTPIVSTSEETLDGITLIGVFASAGSAGVVVARESGEKLRVVKGESLDGWQLRDVGPRSAVFASDSGAEDRIKMDVVSSIPAAARATRSEDRGVADNGEPQKSEEPPEKLTFESMYKKQAAEAKKRNSDTKSK